MGLWANDEDDGDIAVVAAMALGLEGEARFRESVRKPNFLHRSDLLPDPRVGTPWQATYDGRNDQAFILTTGLDVSTFEYLLEGFEETWNSMPVPRDDVSTHGQPRRSLSAAGALGLILQYLNSTMPEYSLHQIFAITPTVCSRYLELVMDILQRHLRSLPEYIIAWPSNEETFKDYASMIELRHPSLENAFCFVDGLNIPVATSLHENVQNAYYNGWTCSHYCSCVFAFAPNGRIIFASLNAPGSWHDATIARDLYSKLLDRTPENYFAIADTAFPRNQSRMQGRIKTPIKSNDKLPRELHAQGRLDELQELMRFNSELVSARQAAEWGMRAFQGSFARLKMPLPADDHEYRYRILEICARLHQLRTVRVGINQIRNVYERIWRDEDANALVYEQFRTMLFREITSNDRIARYYRIHLE
ncbi:hypothetical protein PINS_up012262 [Pythium insidiosum]|nr:hypothetical protein PINS_up012262 [Pythium insidiosum]